MTKASTAAAPPDPASRADGGLAASVTAELAGLDLELAEIDLLITQARTESGRHEQKRATAAEKLAGLQSATPPAAPSDLVELSGQLVTLTKRASVMEAQVDVLEGKRKTLARMRESLARVAEGLASGSGGGGAAAAEDGGAGGTLPPSVSRMLMTAQEDLRREIARAMHDGPAQSLTNIVLQAQIVERLTAKDPAAAHGEVRQLIAMVQQTLDATKSFIFDVRPMVLDDLGLVPTLRRSARERGRRAGIPVEFESQGTDRRLSMELESGMFRMLDEALAAYLGAGPEHVTLTLDWGDQLEATVSATKTVGPARAVFAADAEAEEVAEAEAKDLPPALAEMMEERRRADRAAADAARSAMIVQLPGAAWREIEQRATTIGVRAELGSGGSTLRLVADLPAAESAAS